MAGLVPAIHVLRAWSVKDVDARDKPGHDESWAALSDDRKKAADAPYSAGLASGGGLAGGGVVEACAAAAFFSTMATATIAPS